MGREGILLVEDDPVDVASVRRACRRAGIERPIWVVRDGREAMAHLGGVREEKPARRSPDPWPGLILLDLNLPLKSGLELLTDLKADPALRRIPVVVFSTSGREGDVAACYERGAAGYIVKPLSFEAFVRVMETIDRYWALSESCSASGVVGARPRGGPPEARGSP